MLCFTGGICYLALPSGGNEDGSMFEERAVLFWPVGTGDSTPLAVRGGEIIFQVDLRHTQKSEDEETDSAPIIDLLVENLPRIGGRPYLSTFALTHPDKDHVQGFEDLQAGPYRRAVVSPRVFREHDEDPGMCEDAQGLVRANAPLVRMGCLVGRHGPPSQARKPVSLFQLLAGDQPAGGDDVREVPAIAQERRGPAGRARYRHLP